MTTKNNLEIRRKAVHIFCGIFTAIFYYFGFIKWSYVLALVIVGGIFSYLIKVRNNPANYIHKKWFLINPFMRWWIRGHHIPIVDNMLDNFERDECKKTFPGKGALFLFIGMLLSMILFDVWLGYKDIAIASIMILTLGDSVSALLGPFGNIPHPLNKVKLIEGTIAGIIAGYVGAVIFVSPIEALLGSTVAMLVEALDLKFSKIKLDDNILVPLIAGIVMLIVRGF